MTTIRQLEGMLRLKAYGTSEGVRKEWEHRERLGERSGAGKISSNKLSKEEKKALSDYRLSGHSKINSYLRGTLDIQTNRYVDEKDVPWVNSRVALMDGMASRFTLGKDEDVYRGVGEAFPEMADDPNSFIGKVFKDKGFVSTSDDFEKASPFSDPEKRVMFQISLKAGQHGIDMSRLSGRYKEAEREFILPRGTALRIVSHEVITTYRQVRDPSAQAEHDKALETWSKSPSGTVPVPKMKWVDAPQLVHVFHAEIVS